MSVHLSRAIRQSSIGDPTLPDELPRNGKGFLYKFKDGSTYYSPMTRRPYLRCPPVRKNPAGSTLDGRNFDLGPFLEPQWWTPAQPYFGFIPLKHTLFDLPANPLSYLPKVYYDQEKKRPVPAERQWGSWRNYQNDINTASHLLLYATGTSVVRPAAPCVRVDNHVEKWSKGRLKDEILKASCWFEVWYGVLSYAIVVHEAVDRVAGRVKGTREVPGWLETLLAPRKEYEKRVEEMRERNRVREIWQHEAVEQTGRLQPQYELEDFSSIPRDEVINEAFASSLLNSCIARFDGSVERVGVFVKLSDHPAKAMASIDWLCSINVPVFYPWGEVEEALAEKYPHYKRYAPPDGAEEVECVSDPPPPLDSSMPIPSESPMPSVFDLSDHILPPITPDPPVKKRKYKVREEPPPEERSWEAAFEEIEACAEQELALLPIHIQTKRQAWRRNPPTDRKKTQYFIWEWVKEEKRCVKRVATEEDFEDIEGYYYGSAQRRYFPSRNQWHLCEYMGPPDMAYITNLAEQDVDEGEADYDAKFDEAVKKWRIYYHLEPLPNEDRASERLPATRDQELEEGEIEMGEAEVEMGKHLGTAHSQWEDLALVVVWMQEALGFTLPPGLDREALVQGSPFKKGIAKYIYLLRTSTQIDPQYWNTQEGEAATKFIWGVFREDEALPRELCDLCYECPAPIRSIPRFQAIRRAVHNVRVQSSAWDNIEGYSFDVVVQSAKCYWLNLHNAAGWFAGATSAASILLMTRLPSSPSPYDIALSMALRGARFQTWFPVQDLDEARITPAQAPHILLYRSSTGYHFSRSDYEQYQIHLRNVLDNESRERAAIRRGGIIWKLALDAGVEPRRTLRGPPTLRVRLGQCVVRYVGEGCFFVDDALNVDEEAAISGTYISLAKENQLQRVSWWPDPQLWELHFGTLGWSEAAEAFYQKHKDRILKEYQPWTREQWRKELQLSGRRAAKFWEAVEKEADAACTTEGGLW